MKNLIVMIAVTLGMPVGDAIVYEYPDLVLRWYW